jgi:hypothetical protein
MYYTIQLAHVQYLFTLFLNFVCLLLFYSFVVLGIKLNTSHMLGKGSTTELYPRQLLCLLINTLKFGNLLYTIFAVSSLSESMNSALFPGHYITFKHHN